MFAIWFIDWTMSFSWVDWISALALAMSDALRSVVAQLGSGSLFLTILAAVAGMAIIRGRFALRLFEVLMGCIVASVAFGGLSNPVNGAPTPSAPRSGRPWSTPSTGPPTAARDDPVIDVRLLATGGQWPVQLTAFLFGISVLGAQIPLSTFARTDPDVVGYGLGADASFVSTLIGVYVVLLAVGAFTLPLTTRLLGERGALVAACLVVALGYGLWLPLHGSTGQALVNMAVIGLGSGALVAALPAIAAAAAPPTRTGFATGMTNATKPSAARSPPPSSRSR